MNTQDDPRGQFVGWLVAACHVAAIEDQPGNPSATWQTVGAAFAHFDETTALDLSNAVAERLFASGQRTGSFKAWAAALHHLPRRGQREAAQSFATRVDAWVVRSPAAADVGLRRLRRLACDLIRAGTYGRELLRRLNEANATLASPISSAAIGNVALWAADVTKKEYQCAA